MLPYQITTCSGRVEPHTYQSYPICLTEPHMGGFSTDDFCQVRWPGRLLEGERLPIGNLVMEGQRYPRPVHSPLIQRALNVEEAAHLPWNREVHGSEFPN